MTRPEGSGRLDPIPTSPWIRFWENGDHRRSIRACRPWCPAHAKPCLPSRACRPAPAGPRRPAPAVPRLPSRACRPTPARACRRVLASPCPDPAASDAPRDSYGRSGCRPACGVARAEHGSSARCRPGTSESARQVRMSALVVRACKSRQKRAGRRPGPRRVAHGPRPIAQGPRVSPEPPKTVSPDWYASNPGLIAPDPASQPGF